MVSPMVFDVRPGPVPGQVSSTPEADPIPQLGRLLWLNTKNADSWEDSNSGDSAEPTSAGTTPTLSGGAYTFDGTDDFLVMPESDNNRIAFGHIFVVCRTNDRTKRQSILIKQNPSSTASSNDFAYRIGIREINSGADGRVEIQAYHDTPTTVTATNPAPDSEYFLAEFLLEPDGTLTYRQNGVDNGSTSGAVMKTSDKTATNVYIGRSPSGGRFFDGEIAHLSIYARPLTAAERNQVYTHCETWVPSITRA